MMTVAVATLQGPFILQKRQRPAHLPGISSTDPMPTSRTESASTATAASALSVTSRPIHIPHHVSGTPVGVTA